MAGLWEPVSGVFWRTPPAMADEVWPFLPVIIVLLVATFVSAAVGVRVAKKHKQPEWHLRQHMTEIGGAVTFVYLVGIAALTWGRIGTLGVMPLNEVGDFLAGAFGPVAFLWLVFGFLQQGDELRMSTKALEEQAAQLKNSVQYQCTMAVAALEQLKVQQQEAQMQRADRDRQLVADITIDTLDNRREPRGMAVNALKFTNNGNDAYGVEVEFEPSFEGAFLLKPGHIKAGGCFDYPLRFYPSHCHSEGTLRLSYRDIEQTRRQVDYEYTFDHAEVKFSFRKRV